MEVPEIKPEWLVGITMTTEQKRKWLDALRSGRYQQSSSGRTWDGKSADSVSNHCCLAVLAVDVVGTPNHGPRLSHWQVTSVLRKILGAWSSSIHDKVYDWREPGTVVTLQRALAALHDSGHSFAEISDFIEAKIPACDEVLP